MQNNGYDIAVIGGGPAGLQATLVLARTRKRIIVFDDPQPPRNAASHGVHNLLGLDGLFPAKIREIAWEQIKLYQSAMLCNKQVTNIEKLDDTDFCVTSSDDTSIRAKHVILAFGYQDIHPNIPGFAECWADTIISCPYCDGYENRDRVWGIVATSERDAYHFPMLAHNWTQNVTLLLQSGISIDSDYHDKLIAAGILVHTGNITQIHHTGGKVECVLLDTEKEIEVGTLLWIPPKKPLPLVYILVEKLGLEVDDIGFIKTDSTQQTNVPNLWAVGDVQNGRWALDAIYTGGKVANTIIKDWYR